MEKQRLTQGELKNLLHYDPDTGVFVWRKRRSGVRRPNKVAGGVNGEGYIHIKIDGANYKAHRLAFLYQEGYFPEHRVDHLNGYKADNSWKNLRHVTHRCNLQNSKRYSTNTSGFPGVNWNKRHGKWLARVMFNGNSVSLGYHTTALDAALARLAWETMCPGWACNHRSELVKSITVAWPEFNKEAV